MSFTIKIPSDESNGLNIYDDDQSNTAVFTLEPGDNIAITLGNGESFYWAGDGGDCHPQLIGRGW